jgi:hypothetical protein
MRWLKVVVPVVALGVFVAEVANANVPAFVRQTGLVCNQCHMTWTPNPDMTFTGTKFRLNGYRTPWVAEKIEAGEEGALNGRRLVLGIDGYLSYHMRSQLATQTKSASDPSLAEPSAGSIATRPFNSLAWDFTGPITENIGIWTEWYSTQQQNVLGTPATANQYGVVDNDEFDVKMVFNPGDGGNIVGFGINNQSRTSPFFGAFGSGVSSSQGNTVNVGGYVWLRDRVALNFTLIPGQNEQDVGGWDYKRLSYGFTGAVLPMNTDAMWLMFTGAFMIGNDMNPIGNVTGVSALRTGPGAGMAYTSYDLGDAKRLLLDVRFGALDKGHWSWNTATGLSVENETYSDGAEVKNTSFGSSWRIFYERTYGLLINANKRLAYSYTEGTGPNLGKVHDIPNDVNFGASLVYRQAMNFAWELAFSNNQSLKLDQNWRNGWNWNLQWHFLY